MQSVAPLLGHSQAALLSETLRVALLQAADGARAGTWGAPLTHAASACPQDPAATTPPHRLFPAVGTTVSRVLTVHEDDTAAAMGHPDKTLQVLGSPRLALWFELVASAPLPPPDDRLTHVGVGILVHHLAPADMGQEITVEATVEAAFGRRIVFACAAAQGSRVVALGVHQRLLMGEG